MSSGLPLHEIELPATVAWWPPAPGWWLLPLLIALLIVGFYWLRIIMRRPRLKRAAQAELERLLQATAAGEDELKCVQQLSRLLRRIGISYLPRASSAGVIGRDWYRKLNALGNTTGFSEGSIELLLSAPYQHNPRIDRQALQKLQDEARGWVRSLPRYPRAAGGDDV
jgi:hypothetical protein